MTRRVACLILLVAPGPAFSQGPPETLPDTFQDVRRIVAIGDVHGDYQRFLELLRTAALIDAKNAWTGGDTHLVLDGDFVDRGDHSAQVLDLLMDLEPQARKAGGRLHALIGNHEAMDLYGDLRYVTKDDFAGFQGPNSKDLQDRQMREALDDLKRQGTPPADENAWRKKFQDEHPLGWVEHRMAFQPDGKYGKWLRQLNAIIKINDAVFLHGGISAKYAAWTRTEINTKVRKELSNFSQLAGGIVTDDEGPSGTAAWLNCPKTIGEWRRCSPGPGDAAGAAHRDWTHSSAGRDAALRRQGDCDRRGIVETLRRTAGVSPDRGR